MYEYAPEESRGDLENLLYPGHSLDFILPELKLFNRLID